MNLDRWGAEVEAGSVDSLVAWNAAWGEAMHFTGDPFATLASANASDDAFVMGSIFCGTYRVLGGARPDDVALLTDLDRATTRASTWAERMHVTALGHLIAGDFTKAGRCWDEIAGQQRDFAAIRFAHDVYLHVGDEARRLRSSQRAMDSWKFGASGWGFIAGQLAFAMEEVGLYSEAEELGRVALDRDPLDLWARHALAHLYETLDDTDAAFFLLNSDQFVWAAQDGLAVHIWWHLALRLIATGAYDEALAIHDTQIDVATTPFRLCDMASLLWRLELVGVDVGSRWDVLADRFAARPEWHTSGFLDVHAALTYSRRPDHEAARRFFDGVARSHQSGRSENDHIFAGVVQPLVTAIRLGSTEPAHAVTAFDDVSDRTHRIGGSIAQRELIGLTRSHYEALSSAAELSHSESLTQPDALEAI